jgi:hypothetical protein
MGLAIRVEKCVMISHVRCVKVPFPKYRVMSKKGNLGTKVTSSGWDKGHVERYDEHHYLIMKSER